MTNPAAFKATYSDWRLIKGRKVVQVVLELPLEAAGEAYDALGGMPRPDREVWCAVARLQEGGAHPSISHQPTKTQSSQPASPPLGARAPSPHATRIAILCGKEKFWKFLEQKLPHYNSVIECNESAADSVRHYCGVKSRADILPGTPAENRWLLLLSSYQAWDIAPRVGAA